MLVARCSTVGRTSIFFAALVVGATQTASDASAEPAKVKAAAPMSDAPRCRSERSKIVGGDVANPRDWPGQVALRLHAANGGVSKYFCGGTLISDAGF
ncbi:MAG: hypothetical protein SH859_04200 [Hyphomicrobium aestuarii]|nr:hypothetical protein [Hyphomicrobium aestuarii]